MIESPDRSTEIEFISEEKGQRDPLVNSFYKTVLGAIHSFEVEGIPSEQFDAMRPELARYWTEVVKTECIIKAQTKCSGFALSLYRG